MPRYGEYGYHDLLTEKEFLRVRLRAKALPSGSHIKEILVNEDDNYPTVVFKTESATTPGLIWTQRLVLKDAGLLDNDMNAFKLRNAIKDSFLEIHCDCPAFLYWGYQYKAWTRGYGIEVETRFPKIRNPHLQGYVCKHLYNVLEIYPFLLFKLQSLLKDKL